MKYLVTLLAMAASVLSVVAQTGGSLDSNRPVAQADLTVQGSDWLWAAFAIMLSSAIGVFAWSFMVPPGHRAFHWIGIAILLTASVAYFSMAADLGAVAIDVEFVRYRSDLYTGSSNPYTRSIWYVRYIDWVITTPLLLLELLLATGMPLSGLFGTIFMDELMIVAGLIGALVPSSYKWGYFTGSCFSLLYISWVLLVPARANAKALSAEAHRAYIISAAILCFLWLLYPVAWGLCDGGNVISVDAEMIFYGILDVLAKPVFLFIHLFSLRKLPYDSFQLTSGHFSAYSSVPGNNFGAEKRPVGAHTPAAGNVNGTTTASAPVTRRSDATAV